jgi:hypothetical protein
VPVRATRGISRPLFAISISRPASALGGAPEVFNPTCGKAVKELIINVINPKNHLTDLIVKNFVQFFMGIEF